MIYDNFCTGCNADIALYGHANSCPALRADKRQRASEHLFNASKTATARRPRVWNRPPRVRASRTKVLAKPITHKGEPDKRFNWKKVA